MRRKGCAEEGLERKGRKCNKKECGKEENVVVEVFVVRPVVVSLCRRLVCREERKGKLQRSLDGVGK